MSKQQATLSKLRSTLLPQTATMSNEYRKIQSFQQRRNKLNMFDIVERIVKLVAFDNVAWTLLLVWTGLNSRLADCAFIVAAPSSWISLPADFRSVPSFNSFSRQLKTVLFSRFYS